MPIYIVLLLDVTRDFQDITPKVKNSIDSNDVHWAECTFKTNVHLPNAHQNECTFKTNVHSPNAHQNECTFKTNVHSKRMYIRHIIDH